MAGTPEHADMEIEGSLKIRNEYTAYLRKLYHSMEPAFMSVQSAESNNIGLVVIKKKNWKVDDVFVKMLHSGKIDRMMKQYSVVKPEELLKIDGEKRKRILIEGASGAGKTTVAWHICNLWGSGKAFQEFSLVVLIQLEQQKARSAHSLSDLFPAKDAPVSTKSVLSGLQKQNGNGTLFVIDSWDAYPYRFKEDNVVRNLLVGLHQLDNSAMVVTSRPIAAGSLYPLTYSRVEVIGLTPLSVSEYLEKQFLPLYLPDHQRISLSCYLPLNVALIAQQHVVASHQYPVTSHDILLPLILGRIDRELEREGKSQKSIEEGKHITSISSFRDFHKDIQDPLKRISCIAYHCIIEGKVTFSASDLQSYTISRTVDTLGIIEVATSPEKIYHFPSLCIMEQLAALFICSLPLKEQIQQYKGLIQQPHRYAYVLQYYGAFTKFRAPELRNFFTNEEFWKNRFELLSVLHCIYGAQEKSVCELVASQINQALNLRNTLLKTVDCVSISYFICTTSCGKFSVDLSCCSLNRRKLCSLAKASSKYYRSMSYTGAAVLELDLSNNSFHGCRVSETESVSVLSNMISRLSFSVNELQGKIQFLGIFNEESPLTELDLKACSIKLSEENGHILSCLLQRNSTLESLDMSWNTGICDDGVYYIAKGLMCNRGLKNLQLCDCGITAKGAGFLAQVLEKNEHLTMSTLVISGNNIGDDGIKMLSHSLKFNSSLKEVCLAKCKITRMGAEYLADAVCINRSLETLCLFRNPISDRGAVSVIQAVTHPLKKVNLEGCGLSNKGTKAIAQALRPINLKALDIGHSELGNDGIQHISKALHDSSCTLQKLTIRNCGITSEGAEYVTAALEMNSSLNLLDLSQNLITDEGASYIADALKRNKYLQRLDMQNCGLEAQGLKSLAHALEVNCSIEYLNLSGNLFSDIELLELGESLQKNSRLVQLYLWDLRNVTTEGIEKFVSALKENEYLKSLSYGGTPDKAATIEKAVVEVNKARRRKGIRILDFFLHNEASALAIPEDDMSSTQTVAAMPEDLKIYCDAMEDRYIMQEIVICLSLQSLSMAKEATSAEYIQVPIGVFFMYNELGHQKWRKVTGREEMEMIIVEALKAGISLSLAPVYKHHLLSAYAVPLTRRDEDCKELEEHNIRSHTTFSKFGKKEIGLSMDSLNGNPDIQESHTYIIECCFHFLNGGCQLLFLDVLPAFVQNPSLYYVTTNLMDRLSDRPSKTFPLTNEQIILQGIATAKAKDYSDLNAYFDNIPRHPRFMIIGTCYRELKQEASKHHLETLPDKNIRLRKSLEGNETFLIRQAETNDIIFPMDRSIDDNPELQEIIASLEADYKSKISARWLYLKILLRRVGKVVSREICYRIATRDLKFVSEEFNAALQYFHSINAFLYYPEILKEVVFTDPQIVLDKVNWLFKEQKRLEILGTTLPLYLSKFLNQALITDELLQSHHEYYGQNFSSEDFACILQHLLLVAQVNGCGNSVKYFMPSLLKPMEDVESLNRQLIATSKHHVALPDPLLIHFPDGWAPNGLFSALVVLLLGKQQSLQWRLNQLLDDEASSLYKNFICFTVGDCCITLLNNFKHFAVHLHHCDGKKLPYDILPKVKEAIHSSIVKACKKLSYKETHRFAFYCPCEVDDYHAAIASKTHLKCTLKADTAIKLHVTGKQQVWFTGEQWHKLPGYIKFDSKNPGICFFSDAVTKTVDPIGAQLSWSDCGVTIFVPPGAVPKHQCMQITVHPCFSGPYILPDEYEFASLVYLISPKCDFQKCVHLSIEHCIHLSDEEDCSLMFFFVSASSKPTYNETNYKPEYHFKVINGIEPPIFQQNMTTGVIKLKHFCHVALSRRKKPLHWSRRPENMISRQQQRQRPSTGSRDTTLKRSITKTDRSTLRLPSISEAPKTLRLVKSGQCKHKRHQSAGANFFFNRSSNASQR